MNTDIFALLESKRALLSAAAIIWLQLQKEFGLEFGGVLWMQVGLLVAFVIADAIRPVRPKGILTKKDERTTG